MKKFKIHYTIYEGPTHHDPDYMDPNVSSVSIPYRKSCTIDSEDEDGAKIKFITDHPTATIDSIEEIL
jgi:hypothetical protein